jgi:hypothetical protein
MTLALPPHVYLAVLGDDVVLLDTVADAYFCVPDGVALLRPSCDRGAVAPPDAAVIASLVDAGLLDRSAAATPRVAPMRPTRSLDDPPDDRATATELLRLCGALWDLAWRYRGRRLTGILAYVSAEADASHSSSKEEVLRLAGLFQRWVAWLPIPRKCLVRSFILLRFLQRSGQHASWVFGVATWPFAAHCWLQLDDVALDDHAERLVEYEPILAVG